MVVRHTDWTPISRETCRTSRISTGQAFRFISPRVEWLSDDRASRPWRRARDVGRPERTRDVPTVVLTGTRSDDELRQVYDRGANACLVKPVDPVEFADLVQRTVEFWVTTVVLPPDPETDGVN